LSPSLKINDAEALGGPARRPNLLGLDADDLAAHRDDEEVVLGHPQERYSRPDLRRDLEVDQSLAAPALLPRRPRSGCGC